MRTEDGYIIQQCLDGNFTAFGLLVDKYKRSIYALAYSQIPNFHDAQDITQEVFIKAYRNLNTLKRWDNFMGWLYRITMNISRDWIRSSARRLDSEFIEDQNLAELDNPSIESYRQETMNDYIREELESLPEIYKQVLTLKYYGGMTIREMSSFLGISTATVERRIREAQAKLREEILTMIDASREQHELPGSFTFNIIEIIKNIRINPIPPIKTVPLGLSLVAGIMLVVLGFGSHINISGSLPEMVESLLSGREYSVTIGDFVPFRLSLSYTDFSLGTNGNGNGVMPTSSQGQNLLAMAPKEGGKIPDKPSIQIGKGELLGIAYSPDGKIFVASTSFGARLYDADNLNEIGTLQNNDQLGRIAISPDGKLLAAGGSDQSIHLWDIQERKEIGVLKGYIGWICGINFSPDGTILASCAADDESIRLWDVRTQKQLSALKLDIGYAANVVFSPDGKFLASNGWEGEKAVFQLWSIGEQGKLELIHRIDGAYHFAFNPDGKTMLLEIQDGTKLLQIWDIEFKKQIGELKGGIENISCANFSPDGKWLAFGDFGGSIYLWDMPNQRQVGILNGHKYGVSSLSFSPDGNTLASEDYKDQTILFWDIQEKKQTNIIEGFSGSYFVAFSPNGKTLASGAYKITFWNVADQKKIGECIPADFVLEKLTFSPDGKILAGYSWKTIYLINANEHKLIGSLKGHTDAIRSIAFSPDGKFLASGSLDMTLRLWDVQQQKEVWMQNCPMHTHAVTFTPDGKSLIVGIGGNGSIIIYDAATKKQTDTLQTPGYVTLVAVSPDGKLLASHIGDGTVIFWDLAKKNQLGTINIGNNVVFWSLIFSPDSKWLASTSGDGIGRIWDANTREELARLKGLVYNMSFSPDGKWLATSGDGTIQLWEVDIPIQSKSVNPMGKATGTWGDIKKAQLFQNYPNPFNPETWIPYQIENDSNVEIGIYSSEGVLVRTIELGSKQAGSYTDKAKSAYWDGKDDKGQQVSSGIYFYVLKAGDFTASRKMVVLM